MWFPILFYALFGFLVGVYAASRVTLWRNMCIELKQGDEEAVIPFRPRAGVDIAVGFVFLVAGSLWPLYTFGNAVNWWTGLPMSQRVVIHGEPATIIFSAVGIVIVVVGFLLAL